MLLDLAHRAQELFLGSKPEEKRVLIQTSLQNLTMKDGLLCYEWKKPFDSIAKSKECNTWGG
jgi:glutamine synthetase type III